VRAASLVEEEVRQLLQRRGIDPMTDLQGVRTLVEDVVSEYGERTLVSDLPKVHDSRQLVADVVDAVAGFGPIQRYLDDSSVE